MRRLFQVLMVAGLPAALTAQAGPVAGTWGAEGSSGTASLIRFRSSASAIVLSVAASYDHDNPLASGDRTSVSLRLGTRRYSGSDQTRPFRTFSLAVDHTDFGSLMITNAGVGAEFGASHFFTQHVSLGASGELLASISWSKTSSFSSSTSESGFGVRFGGFRIFGGVYF